MDFVPEGVFFAKDGFLEIFMSKKFIERTTQAPLSDIFSYSL